MFLKNAWYVACTPDELGDEAARSSRLRRGDGLLSHR